jgi:hypothetical protein
LIEYIINPRIILSTILILFDKHVKCQFYDEVYYNA